METVAQMPLAGYAFDGVLVSTLSYKIVAVDASTVRATGKARLAGDGLHAAGNQWSMGASGKPPLATGITLANGEFGGFAFDYAFDPALGPSPVFEVSVTFGDQNVGATTTTTLDGPFLYHCPGEKDWHPVPGNFPLVGSALTFGNSCIDNVRSGRETDVNCGGGSEVHPGCTRCALGNHCLAASDCDSFMCDTQKAACVSCTNDADCPPPLAGCNIPAGRCY